MAKKQTALDKAKLKIAEQEITIGKLHAEIDHLEVKTKIVDLIIEAVVKSKQLSDFIQEEVGIAVDGLTVSR